MVPEQKKNVGEGGIEPRSRFVLSFFYEKV